MLGQLLLDGLLRCRRLLRGQRLRRGGRLKGLRNWRLRRDGLADCLRDGRLLDGTLLGNRGLRDGGLLGRRLGGSGLSSRSLRGAGIRLLWSLSQDLWRAGRLGLLRRAGRLSLRGVRASLGGWLGNSG